MSLALRMDEGVEVAVIDRQGAANGLDSGLVEELFTVVQSEGPPLLLTGAGKTFCAGVDLTELAGLEPTEAAATVERFDRLLRETVKSTRVLVAAVNGDAYGGGVALALACDVRVARGDAVFHFTPLTLGAALPPFAFSLLSASVGLARARSWLFTGRRVRAEEGLFAGLVDYAVQTDPVQFGMKAAKGALKLPEGGLKAQKAIALGEVEGRRVETAGLFRELSATEGWKEGLSRYRR